jgi:hypothetical protein
VDQAEVALVIGTLQAESSTAPSAPAGKRVAGKRGAGGYNRADDRKTMNKEKDNSVKLDLFLKIVNHVDNPSDAGEFSESWRSWYRNALLVKACHDVCHKGVGGDFLAKYASTGAKLNFTKWKCLCVEE